tara:strand:- start:50 stop:298 length:249 start_codon:yes stop_codon:yes gene_type:complete
LKGSYTLSDTDAGHPDINQTPFMLQHVANMLTFGMGPKPQSDMVKEYVGHPFSLCQLDQIGTLFVREVEENAGENDVSHDAS